MDPAEKMLLGALLSHLCLQVAEAQEQPPDK